MLIIAHSLSTLLDVLQRVKQVYCIHGITTAFRSAVGAK
jgi:hypothetical protein